MGGPSGKRPNSDSEASTVIGLSAGVAKLVAQVRLARLEVVGAQPARELMLEKPETVVGRSRDADITINHPTLSRRHVIFRKGEGVVRVEDLNSANGMFLNGLKAHAADLHEGDTVQIGEVVLLFHEGQ